MGLAYSLDNGHLFNVIRCLGQEKNCPDLFKGVSYNNDFIFLYLKYN